MNRNTFFQGLVNANSRIKVELFGQWDEAIRVMQRLDPEIKEASVKAQMQIMEQVKKAVKAHLRNQDIPEMVSKPYNAKYAEAKVDAGRDSRFLLSWGTYYRSIEVWRTGNFHFAYVGVRNGIKTRALSGKAARLDVARIAYIHETGGKKVPRRPLWNPTIKEMGGANGFKEAFVEYLHKNLRKKKIPIVKFSKNRIFSSKSWH